MSLRFSVLPPRAEPAARAPWLRRATLAFLPLALLLLWTAALRLPFYTQTDKDEFFFSVIGAEWLKGGLPYVALFDVKPPGLFFIYALVQTAFGASQLTIKSMEIVAVTAGAYALYRLVKAYGTPRAALWAAALFPVYTITLDGTVAVNMLLQLPLVIAAFAAALSSVREETAPGDRLAQAFLAGLAIGAAGMVKQTAIFEAVAAFTVLCVFGERRLHLIALFVAGAALPAAAFALYFLAAGHFQEMFQAVVLLALKRADSDVVTAYGSEFANYFTTVGMLQNAILRSGPLVFLWAGAWLACRHLARLKEVFPLRLLMVAGLWLAASFAGVLVGRGLCNYYLLAIVPPLLILASAFFGHGLEVAPRLRSPAFALSLVAAAASMVALDRGNLFWPDAFLAGDFDATREVSSKLVALGLVPQDKLLVLNRGFAVYTETGALPPTPYFHALHLLGVFHTPSPDPLGETLRANPRFIVIADPSKRLITELASRYDRALAYVAAHYHPVAAVTGAKDSFTIYEFVG